MEAHGLDDVIQDLKERGIQAGKKEASRLEKEAKEKADKIIKDAKKEAEEIVSKAKKQAETTQQQMEAELRNTTQVALAAFRQSMEKGFLLPEVDKAIKPIVTKPEFLEKTLGEMIKAFADSGFAEGGIQVLLPDKTKNELEGAFVQRLKTRASSKVEVAFDDSISYGFQIGPADGSFVLDMSEEGFRQIFMKFLSPRFRRFFGTEESAKKKPGDQTSKSSAEKK
jgi:V/A-type H+-transporting ATPase subunit E